MWHAHLIVQAAQNELGYFPDDSNMVCPYFKPSWRLMAASWPLPSSAVPCMGGGRPAACPPVGTVQSVYNLPKREDF